LTSSVISRHFPALQRGGDERSALHELFKSHLALPSLKSESVINRATPNASEAKCVQAGVILLAGSAGLLRLSDAAHRGKAVFN
jgi:hypothetical protein